LSGTQPEKIDPTTKISDTSSKIRPFIKKI